MKLVSYILSSLFLYCCALAQSDPADKGIADSVALHPSIITTNQSDSIFSVEIWVFSDERIVSFSCDFSWNNPKLRLDSAKESSAFSDNDYYLFFFYKGELQQSNINKRFQFGGYSVGSGLEGDPNSRRLWATFYFSMNNWSTGDSVQFDLASDADASFEFVSMGPFYPFSFQPVFEGPIRFPGMATDILENDETLPTEFKLFQNYPNPFNPKTTIEFELTESSNIDLSIYNILGQKVTTLYHGRLSVGLHKFEWDTNGRPSEEFPSGVYLYRLTNGDLSQTKKMLLLR